MSIWQTKPLSFLVREATTGQQKLERTLGAWNLILLGIGAIIGAGLFSITGVAAAMHAGPAVILSFFIAALGCLFAGLCFSELAAMIPISGGAYSYAYVTLGEVIAWMVGWIITLEYMVGAAFVAISWSAYVVSTLQDFGIHLPAALLASPWQKVALPDGSHVHGIINLPPLILVSVLSGLLIWGVDKSAKVNAVLVFIKVAVVLTIIALGAFYIDPANYTPFIPENTGVFGEFGWSGVFSAAGLVFLGYVGFETVSTMAQEVKNPQRDLPIGIIGSLAICTVLFMLFAFVLVGLAPYTELGVAAPVAAAIQHTPYLWVNGLVKCAIIAGLTSVVLVLLLGQSRIFFTMAKDGLLPSCFGIVHPKYHTPWVSSVVLMGIVGIFSAFAPLYLAGHLTNIASLIVFTIVCGSVVVLRKTHPHLPRPFKTPWVPFVPILGMIICLLLIASLGWFTSLQLLVWLMIGLGIYFLYGKKHSHLQRSH